MSLGHRGNIEEVRRLNTIKLETRLDIETEDQTDDCSGSKSVNCPCFESCFGQVGEKQRANRLTIVRLGVGIMFLGSILLFSAFSFAAQSLLAALGAVQFLSNVIFSRYILGNLITRRVLLSTFAIVVGEVLVVSFADHQSRDYTVKDLMSYYDEIDYQVSS